jgi:Ca2+:H+ antiporter
MAASSRLSAHWPLLLVPVAIAIGQVPGISPPLVFFAAALAIIPVARLIGHGTENLATYTGDAIGGLLNATFGNLPELIIMVVALKAGLHAMVAASIVGAILFNLLLALGIAFLLGGRRYHTQRFNAGAANIYASMMFIAVLSLALPSMYQRLFASAGPIIEQHRINVGLAVVLAALYALYLFFMVRTHPEEFASVGEGGGGSDHGGRWSLGRSLTVLVGASVIAAVLSEILVAATEGTAEVLGLSAPFIGIVLLASTGGAAEALSAISMAGKDRLDLTLGILFGACIQIALFVAPVLVFASYFLGPEPFLLSFSGGAVGLLFLAVLIGSIVASHGQSNWYKGVQLVAVYLMIALMLYFVPL